MTDAQQQYPKIKNAIFLCLLLTAIQLIIGAVIGLLVVLCGYTKESPLYGLGTIAASIMSFSIVIFIGWKKTKSPFNSVFKFNRVPAQLWVYTLLLHKALKKAPVKYEFQ